MNQHSRIIGMFAVLSFFAGSVLCSCSKGTSGQESQAAKVSNEVHGEESVEITDEQISNLTVKPVESKLFSNEIVATGRVSIDEEKATPLLGSYTGKVTKVYVSLGRVVKIGDPLLELDSPDIAQAEADALGAQAAWEKARSAVSLSQKNISLAHRNMELASSNVSRQQQLFDDQSVARKDLEQAQRDATQAERDLEQSSADVVNATNDLEAAASSLAAMHHRLQVFGKSAEDIDRLFKEKVIDRHITLEAANDGTVIARKVALGQFIRQDNTDALFIIADLSVVWLVADIPESDLPAMRVGELAHVHVLAFPDEELTAPITFVSPGIDPNTRRGQIRCALENTNHRLKTDMFCTFRISTGADQVSTVLPSSAIIRNGLHTFIWSPMGAHKFVRHEVHTGLVQAGLVQIIDGIKSGDQVVIGGALFLDNEAKS